MDDNTGVTIVLTVLIIAVLVGALGGCHMCETTDREAIKAGLVKKSTPTTGSTPLHWDKP